MKPVLSMLAGVAFVTVAGAALAEEPTPLTAADLDRVTAGFELAEAASSSVTFGDVFSETVAVAGTMVSPGFAAAAGETGGIAVSLFFNAMSASASQSAVAID